MESHSIAHVTVESSKNEYENEIHSNPEIKNSKIEKCVCIII